MNKTILIGRMAKDAELRYTTENKAIAKGTIAVSRREKDKADFIAITAFGRTAEVLAEYAPKGKQIAIGGEIRTGSYDKEGTKVYTTEVIINDLELLGGGTGNGGTNTPFNEFEPIEDGETPF